MHRLKPNLDQSVARRRARHRQGSHGCLMSFFNCLAELVTVGFRGGIDFREIDQLMARTDCIQATQSHQGADGGLTFTESKQLRAEIGKSALCLSHVSRGLVMLADLSRTHRQLSRPRQLHVSEGKHALERAVSKAQNRSYRPADQLKRYLTQKVDGRYRHQVDTPLHVAPQSDRRYNFGFRNGPGSSCAACETRSRSFVSRRSGAALPVSDQSTLIDRYSQG